MLQRQAEVLRQHLRIGGCERGGQASRCDARCGRQVVDHVDRAFDERVPERFKENQRRAKAGRSAEGEGKPRP